MFTQPLVNTYAIAGYNATLNCSVRGNPKVLCFTMELLKLRINSKTSLSYLPCYNGKEKDKLAFQLLFVSFRGERSEEKWGLWINTVFKLVGTNMVNDY